MIQTHRLPTSIIIIAVCYLGRYINGSTYVLPENKHLNRSENLILVYFSERRVVVNLSSHDTGEHEDVEKEEEQDDETDEDDKVVFIIVIIIILIITCTKINP